MKKIYLNTLTTEDIIKRLKDGEVIKIDGYEGFHYKMVDGIICYITGCYTHIGRYVDTQDCDNYFEEQEELKVDKTGLYKTRDGHRVFISQVRSQVVFGVIEGRDGLKRWSPDGLAFMEDVLDERDHIVSKIEEVK